MKREYKITYIEQDKFDIASTESKEIKEIVVKNANEWIIKNSSKVFVIDVVSRRIAE